MKYRILAAAAASAVIAISPAVAQRSIAGDWLTEDGRAVVTIGRCGETVCGRLSRILAPTPDGPPRDENNPNPQLRNRPIQGITVVSGFSWNGEEYRGGEVYDPEVGRSYDARLRLNRNGSLRVTGCVLGGILCRSQNWSRR